jgi:hypothetical protein
MELIYSRYELDNDVLAKAMNVSSGTTGGGAGRSAQGYSKLVPELRLAEASRELERWLVTQIPIDLLFVSPRLA